MATDSEFRAYTYIEKVLKDLGWNIRNPRRGGQVYTQHEFFNHDPLLTKALGGQSPENIAVIPWDGGMRYWIIEAKPTHGEIGKALKEAQGYAQQINRHGNQPPARFATGVAGMPDQSFYVDTAYFNGQEWKNVAINDYETTGFLSLDQCQHILDANNHRLARFDDDPDRFLKRANAINKALHSNEVPVGDRAGMMAALLLALAQDGNLRIHSSPTALIREINGLIDDLLRQHGKSAFADTLKLKLPATEKNHRKFRVAITDTLQHLREMNIRSAINGSDDALGKFYETFLKYANGAKEMGIVLTPRHITRFAADVLGIGPEDRVFDPACGTGGFLISSMETVRARSTEGGRYRAFANDSLFGVEIRDDVYALALVNMIFRGDGKSHIYDGNCFDHEFWLRDGEIWYTFAGEPEPEGARRPFTRVMINPPYKLVANRETLFIDYAMRQLHPGGLMFAILPTVTVSGASFADWRRELTRRHTLLASIKLDKSLFYPVAEATYALILQAHRPHEEANEVFWGILHDDDHRPRRSKMLSKHVAQDNLSRMTTTVRRFLLGQPEDASVRGEQAITSLQFDERFDWAPEDRILGRYRPISRPAIRAISAEAVRQRGLVRERPTITARIQTFALADLIGELVVAPLATLKQYPPGPIPVVTASYLNNGVAEWKDIPADLCLSHCITISAIHNTRPCEAFWHPYVFSALRGKALVFKPIDEIATTPEAIPYLCEAITLGNSWRYHYNRQPRLDDLVVELPVDEDGMPDVAGMAAVVRSQLQETDN